jgi:hypothetical protein
VPELPQDGQQPGEHLLLHLLRHVQEEGGMTRVNGSQENVRWIVFTDNTGRVVSMSEKQLLALHEHAPEFNDPVWHFNACGCCVSLHENENPHAGYVIDGDGECDWVEAEE